MISQFFHSVFYQPLYNGLILLIDALPFLDVGVIVILFTLLVKLVLFPLSKESVRVQLKMKEIEPEIKRLKEQYKDNQQKQAESVVELYKKHNINPFISVILLFIQLPIIFSLFFVFKDGLPLVQTETLYSFVRSPGSINMDFLGLINLSGKSLFLAIVVGVSAFIQMKIMAPAKPVSSQNKEIDLAQSMQIQMRYMFPVLTAFAAYQISGAISLYWITSNLFAIGQEILLKKKFASKD